MGLILSVHLTMFQGQLSRYVPGVGKIGGVFSFPTPYAILPIYHPSTSIGVGLPRGEWRGADQNTMEGMIALEKVQGQREDIWYTQMRCNSREKVRCNVHIYVRIPDLPDADWEITAHLQDAEFKLSGTQHMSLPKCVEFAVPKAKVQNEVTNTRVRPLLVSFADKYPKRDFESCEWEWYKGVKLAFDQLTP